MKKTKKRKPKKTKKVVTPEREMNLNDGNALQGHASISDYERAKGRGFWGNNTTGYINDEDN